MAVTIEVPEGHKFCRDCGEVKLIDGNFNFRMRLGKRILQPYCAGCMRARWHKWNSRQKEKAPLWVRPNGEVMCDRALMQWRGPVMAGLVARL